MNPAAKGDHGSRRKYEPAAKRPNFDHGTTTGEAAELAIPTNDPKSLFSQWRHDFEPSLNEQS